MKKICIIHTGGTISMQEDEATGAVRPFESHPLLALTNALQKIADTTHIELLRLPSPHITPNEMLMLKDEIEKQAALGSEGIVITHGTDTLEETAYFLDLTLQTRIPVVLTGAMRSSNEMGADGPYNLISAVRTAASKDSVHKGVLVVMNDEVHSAKNVTKTHTSNIATFQSPQFGPIGLVTKRAVLFHHSPTQYESYPINQLTKKVMLIKAFAGMDDSIFNAILEAGYDGVVIEALGQGNMPPATLKGLQNLLKHNIPIVIVSRCFNGIVQDVYDYEGGGRELKKMGIIFSNGLNGQKARLKLLIALELSYQHDIIQKIFEQ
ncbi:asparaginase [Bacillus sp. HMF5848]|uniref:asparaginase n=1 Tax=Bacillus sp. HMF5848 TaxID=2495421 RepID=UPI000F76CDFA|nr:asparaginase [Bacillus sp. HMF5848]RSK27456.1 asparaginase [Bacillus sp. HMF5848]